MAAITICEISHQSVRVQLTGLDPGYNYADRTCKWYIGTTLKKTESLGAAIKSGAENSLTGLSANTTYTVKAVISGTNMSSSVTLTKTFSTSPGSTPPAILSVGTITQNSIQIKLTNIEPSDYTGDSRIVHWWKNGTDVNDNTTLSNSATSTSHTFTGLTAGTSYTLGYSINANNWYTGSSKFTVNATTTELTPEIEIVKQTQNAIYVRVKNITAQSWARYVKWYYTPPGGSNTSAYTGTNCGISANSIYGADYIFNNLDRSTSTGDYTLKAVIYKYSSNSTSSTKTITTTSNTLTTTPTLTCTASSQTSLTFNLQKVTAYGEAQKVSWYYKEYGSSDDWTGPVLTTTINKDTTYVEDNTITGLKPDTRYNIFVYVKKSSQMACDSSYPILCKQSFSSSTYRTKEGASINANAQGPFSIYVNLTNLDTTQSVTRYVKWQCYDKNNNLLKESSSYAFSSSQITNTNSPTYGIRGLAKETKYNIKAVVTVSGTDYNLGPKSATTESKQDFVLSSAADTAVRNHGATTAILVSEWNSLVNTANDVIGGKGWSWTTDSNQGATLTVEDTRASDSDKKLYASMFNSLRYNIGTHYSTGINKVRKWESGTPATDQIVYGAYFVGGAVNGNNVVGLVPALNGLMNSEQIHFTT